MGLETATYIDSLVISNPDGTDARNTSDDHHRLIKACLKRTFPLVAGAISASHAAIGYINDLSGSAQAQLNALRDGSATALNAVNARYANSASYALHSSDAISASFAQSASFATLAGTATLALTANSASYAAIAGTATTAATATNANALGGAAAAAYARLDTSQSFAKGQAITQADSSGSALAPNCDSTTMFRHTMTAAIVAIASPSSARSGMVITIHLVQDGSGGRLAAWSSAFKFAGGTSPTLTTTASAVDVFGFQYDSTSGVWRQAGLDVK